MTAELRDPRPDVDRVLLALQLEADGHHAAAGLALRTLNVYQAVDFDDRIDHLAGMVREWDELIEKARWCADDPRHYYDQHHDDDWPHGRSLLDWSDGQVLELQAEAGQILADIRVAAEAIAAHAEKVPA